jgi:hypothetical protein
MDRPDSSIENRKQQLVDLLSADYAQPDSRARVWERRIGALSHFMSQTRVTKRREKSDENLELGLGVDRLLVPAPITFSFKMFITNSIRRAHAQQTTVYDAIAPDRLGLTFDDGIFSTDRAQEIEAQVWRGVLFDTVKRHLVSIKPDASKPEQVLMIRYPVELRESRFTLSAWRADYRQHFGGDPFEGIEDMALIDAARKVSVQPDNIDQTSLT